jgi:hypothetical protein
MSWSGWVAEGRGFLRGRFKKRIRGEKKGGAAAPGQPFCTNARRWGTARWGDATRQARAERERGRGGCPTPTDRRRPGRQWPEAGGCGRCDAAMPRGRSEQGRGWRLTGGVRWHSASRCGSNGIQTISK